MKVLDENKFYDNARIAALDSDASVAGPVLLHKRQVSGRGWRHRNQFLHKFRHYRNGW